MGRHDNGRHTVWVSESRGQGLKGAEADEGGRRD